MSRIENPHTVDPEQWVGVAAALATFLDSWPRLSPEQRTRFPVPRGALREMKRFFTLALSVISGRGVPSSMPLMAALTSAAVAREVWAQGTHETPSAAGTEEHILAEMNEYLLTIGSLDEDPTAVEAKREEVSRLLGFLDKFIAQGEMARARSMHLGELPRVS